MSTHLLKNVVLSVGLMSVVRLGLMLSSDGQTPSWLVLQIVGQSGQCWVPSEPQPVLVTNSILKCYHLTIKDHFDRSVFLQTRQFNVVSCS